MNKVLLNFSITGLILSNFLGVNVLAATESNNTRAILDCRDIDCSWGETGISVCSASQAQAAFDYAKGNTKLALEFAKEIPCDLTPYL